MSLLPVFFKGLTPELIRKAEIEINETPQIKTRSLIEFKKLISEQKDIYCRPDDIFLLRFLRMKKFDVQKALKVLRNYYVHQRRNAGVITKLKPSNLKKIIDMNIIFYAPYRLPSGSHVAIFRMGNYDPRIATAEDAVGTLLACAELVLECEATQICGSNLIFDFDNTSFEQYKKFMTLNFVKFAASALQETLPERLKGIHYLNEPYLIRTTIKVTRQFVSKKIMDRVYCHGSNLESLHYHIPQQYLPEELGGTLGSISYKDFASYFLSQESFFEKIHKYGIIQKK